MVYEPSGSKMLKFCTIFCLLAALADLVISSDDWEDLENKKMFHFTKVPNEIDRFNFEYILDNGEKFTGKVIPLHYSISNVGMMMGANDSFYWVNFSDENLEKDSFDQVVNHVQLDRENEMTEELAFLMDDFVSYKISKDGKVSGGPYDAEWDLNDVTFELADIEKKIFNFEVFSYNNGRQHRGKTSYTDDPHIQTFNLPGFFEQCYIFQATFTDEQLNSTETMYKGVDRIMTCAFTTPPTRPGAPMEIDANLLKSMVG